ncbi:Mu transposase C-terminal domain-containing protein [Noviherbaspirillum sp.]|jgi:putative transposase|uniref:Mu transposase C-terminal domain-containing protein n=1 Tax=Noviherbaspirillum sp. TaxID=1926288 RepID=UPI0025E02EF2|nr:Mu transposase C-terminal domain-containing protein [Noviherbaspirillum sp.]
MQSVTFKVGTGIDLDGRRSKIIRILEDGRTQLEIESDGTLVVTSREELLHHYAQRRLRFIDSHGATTEIVVAQKFGRSLHTFSEVIQNKAIRKKKYIDFILSHGAFNSTPVILEPIIAECAQQLNDNNPPSTITVWRWYRNLIRSQHDYRALIDRHDLKGGGGSRLHPEVQAMLQDAIERIYLTKERNYGEAVHSELKYRIDKRNEFRIEQEKLIVPSKSTVYRAIASLDKYDEMAARFGPQVAQMKYRTSRQGVRPRFILERVEIDHTPLDLFIIDDETGLPQGRPTVTMAVDAFSKMLVGMHIGFSGTSIEAVFACLRHALIPKTYVKGTYPEIENDWPCYGHIETLVCDNGLEFHSKELERVAFELGTQIQFCPKRQAYYKGSIERFLQTLNYQFSRQLPGHSFAKWFQREDYDPQKHAVLTFNQLTRYLHRWLIDIYSQKLHRGINSTPYRKWTESAASMPPKLLSDLSRLDITLGRTKERTIFHYGIELNNLRYNDPELLMLRRQHGEKVKVDVRYYFGDISLIHVIDPITKESIPVTAVDLQYAQGLSLEQHRLICARARQINNGDIDVSALARAKSEIREIVKELSFSKAQRKRQRAAKIKGVGRNAQPLPDVETTNLPSEAPINNSTRIETSDLPEFGALTFTRS